MTYTGGLNKPRKHRSLPSDADSIGEWFALETDEQTSVLIDLFDWYSIKVGDWPALVIALARAHVPAWSMARAPSGPKPVWDKGDRARLHIVADKMVALGKAASIGEACDILARRRPWTEMLRLGNTNPGEALRQQYKQADPQMVAMYQRAEAYVAGFASPLDALVAMLSAGQSKKTDERSLDLTASQVTFPKPV